MIEIKHKEEGTKGFFNAYVNGNKAGKLSYTTAGNDKIIIDHTEVDIIYKGQNIGKQLVMNAVNFARNRRLKIIPLCPFAKAVFDKTESIQDLLAA